jgi:hypothetical protein
MQWAGRALSAPPVLFLIFDGTIKLANIQPVVDASILLGLPTHLAPAIGSILLACVAVYLLPRFSVLGAILLTGYLGGAVAIQLRAEAGLFSLVFPLMLGALLWVGLYMRSEPLRTLVPLRR